MSGKLRNLFPFARLNSPCGSKSRNLFSVGVYKQSPLWYCALAKWQSNRDYFMHSIHKK